jgi:hypothetical protein
MKRPEHHILRPDWDDERGLPTPPRAPTAIPPLDEASDLRAPGLALRVGLRVLRQEPTLLAWTLGAELAASMLKVVPWVFLLLMASAQLAAAIERSDDPLLWAASLADWVLSPATLLGSAGLLAVTAAAAWLLGLTIQTGALGALRRRLLAGPIPIAQDVFWKALGERALSLLAWELTRAALVGGGLALTLALAYATERHMVALAPHGHWAGAGLWVGAALLGLALTLGLCFTLVLGALSTLSLGPLILGPKSLAEASWEAALDLVARPLEVAWLCARVAALHLALLSVYLPFYLLSQQLSQDPDTSSAGLVLQLTLDAFAWVAGAALTLWGRSALLSWTALRRGLLRFVPELPARAEPAKKLAIPAPPKEAFGPRAAPSREAAPPRDPAQVELAHLLPQDTPAVVTLDALRAAAQDPKK